MVRTEINTNSDEIEPMMVSQWWERKVTKKKHRKNIRSFPNDKKPNEQIINLIELRIVSTGWETKGSKKKLILNLGLYPHN